MTTLIRLILNGRHRAVHRDLADVHAMHQRVMSLLPDDLGDSPRATTATLYRIEDVPPNPRLLIQTAHSTTLLDRLPEGYHLDAASLDLSGLYERLGAGVTVRYAITANPSKRAAHGPQAGKRIALNGYDAVHAWWTRRATASGLDISDQPVDIRPVPAATGTRPRAQRSDAIIHRATRIEGTAIVIDADALISALNSGVGAGKAHGLGLLTVVPVTSAA